MGSLRRRILYVTIDPANHRQPDGSAGGHAANLQRLCQITQQWRSEAVVEDTWCGLLGDELLEADDLLALYLSGSFTEWYESFSDRAWDAALCRLCDQIKRIGVPILAVCGSHQLIGRCFGGWEAVAHVASGAEPPVTIWEERDGTFRAPDPRNGEVGVFELSRCPEAAPDPLLAGIPEPAQFVEYHRDQVVAASSSATCLLRSMACKIQALRYDCEPKGRLLYTLQFHPELPWSDGSAQAQAANSNGARLILNFLDLADEYWKRSVQAP